MRLFFLILLLGNLILFAWGQGFVGGRQAGREPERIERQIAPERLRIVSVSTPTICRRLEWLTAVEAATVQEGVAGLPGWFAEQIPRAEPPAHWVVIPGLASRALAERKIAELRQLGVREGEIVEDAKLGPFAVSLGMFGGQEAAEEYFRAAARKGVRSARVMLRELPPERFALELSAPEGELSAKLPVLIESLGAANVTGCGAR